MKLRILSYNIHKGFDWFNSKLVISQIKDVIRKLNADIVFLQEVVGEHEEHESNHEEWPTETQFEFLADSVWPHFSYAKNAVYDHGHHGNVILSKFPINKWYQKDISVNKYEQRGILHAEVFIEEKDVHIQCYCLHLNLLHMHRSLQYPLIIEQIEKDTHEGDKVIVAGDFNDWGNKACRAFGEQLNLVDCHKLLTGKTAKSFPARMPILNLDRIYTRHFNVLKAEVLTGKLFSKLSDHAPLLVELEV